MNYKLNSKIVFLLTILLGAGLLLTGWGVLAQAAGTTQPLIPPIWVEAAQIPEPMGASGKAQCADDPNGFYLIGGVTNPGNTNNVYHYNAISNTWATLEPLPIALRAQAATCYDGKIYVAGGWSGIINDTLFIYDIATDSWTAGPDLPRPVWGAALGAWDGKVYLVGGTAIGPPYTPVADVDVFDIATNAWEVTPGPPMPIASGFAGYVQTGPYLYIVGGVSGDLFNNVTATQRLDMSAQTWMLGPDFTSGRALEGMAATEQYLYAMGGDPDGDGTGFNTTDWVERLDYTQWPGGAWEAFTTLPHPLFGTAGFCTEALAGGEVWSVGGGDPTLVITDTNLYLPAEPCFTLLYGLALAPETDAQTGYAGETITYTLQVTNTGNVGDSYTVTVNAAWTTTAPVLLGQLDPGATETVEVAVTLPEDASPGDLDTATVTLTSQGDSSQTATTTLTTSASPYAVTFTPTEATGSSYVGETVHYMLLLTNMGSVTDTFTLDFTGNLWTVTPSFTETTLAPGASITLTIQVEIPVSATHGTTDTIVITASSTADPLQTANTTLTTTALWHQNYLPVMVK